MNTYRTLFAVLTLVLFLAFPVSAATPPLPSTPPLVTPIKTEGNNKDVRRAYYRIGKTEVKATIAQMGGQQHFTLWEGKTNVFHFSAPTSKLSYGDMGAFTSSGQTFFYYYANTRIGWRAPGAPPASGRSIVVGKSPVDGTYRIYVDSADYYHPNTDDFQLAIGLVQQREHERFISLYFGPELFSDFGGVTAQYALSYNPSTDSFVYEER